MTTPIEAIFAEDIMINAKAQQQRAGQYLFNHLPESGAATVVAGSIFDPFHKDLSVTEVFDWLCDHLIFDNNQNIIAVFNGNDILWEKEG